MSQDTNRLPPQTKYIVGNEACERLSYYGVVAILTGYATLLFGGGEHGGIEAKKIVHNWKSLTYLLPLLGAFIADRYWGRYRTILWISFAYCAGHALLSATEGTKWGLYSGLILLAIGSGGIKPCVSAFVGDQFGPVAHPVPDLLRQGRQLLEHERRMPGVLLDRQDDLDRLGHPDQVDEDQKPGSRVAQPEDDFLLIPLQEESGYRDRRHQDHQPEDDPGGHVEGPGQAPQEPELLLAGARHQNGTFSTASPRTGIRAISPDAPFTTP